MLMKNKFLDFVGLSTFKNKIVEIISQHASNTDIHMTSTEKSKLSGIAQNANNYSLPLMSSSTRGGAKIGYSQNGKNYPVQLSNEQMYVNVPWTDTNTTYANMKGATASADGAAGLVVAPAKGASNRYLRSDGTWQVPPDTNTVYTHPTTSGNKHIPSGGKSGQILRWSSDGTASWGADNNTTYGVATSSANGLMSASDKARHDKLINLMSQSSEPTTQNVGDLWFKEE